MSEINRITARRPTEMMTWRDAAALIESGAPVTIRCWKLSNGAILEYRDAVCVGSHFRTATHRLKLPASHLIREVRDITIFQVNQYEIIRN